MGDEGTEGNVSSRTLQRINKISRESLNIRFLLIREETNAHKFGEEMAVKIFCFVHTESTDRSSSSTADTRREACLGNKCKMRKTNFRFFQILLQYLPPDNSKSPSVTYHLDIPPTKHPCFLPPTQTRQLG